MRPRLREVLWLGRTPLTGVEWNPWAGSRYIYTAERGATCCVGSPCARGSFGGHDVGTTARWDGDELPTWLPAWCGPAGVTCCDLTRVRLSIWARGIASYRVPRTIHGGAPARMSPGNARIAFSSFSTRDREYACCMHVVVMYSQVHTYNMS